jgi:DNA-binding MarR family transcriptional regulator
VSELHDILDELTLEIAHLFFRLRVAAERHLGQGRHSSGRRSILKSLGADGPQTVPDMARARAVTRQRVQTLVDTLLADGLVTRVPNPAHRRSMLIVLSPAGKTFLAKMNAREVELFEFLGEGIPARDLHTAARVVRELRERLDGERWRQLLDRGTEG